MSEHYSLRAPPAYNLDVYEITDNSPRKGAPPGSKIVLKPHQEALLHRLIHYENNELILSEFESLRDVSTPEQSVKLNGGVIGDRVGSGKSYVILSLIKSNDITNRTSSLVQSFGYNTMTFKTVEKSTSIKTNILVIPHNITSQWEKYVTSFGADIKYLIVNKAKVISDIEDRKINVADYDLLIVTSTFYKHLANDLIYSKRIKVQRLIFDEVDNTTIVGCNRINAMFYWYVTASYGNLLFPRGHSEYCPVARRYINYTEGIRTAGYVKNLFIALNQSLPQELMKILVVKNNEAFIESSLHLPPVINNILVCKTPASVRILHGLVDRTIIQLLNAGDEQGAIAMLAPTQKNTESNIIELMIARYNRDLKNEKVKLQATEGIEYDTEELRRTAITAQQKKIKEIETKINMVKDRIHNNDFCAICYDNLKNKTIVDCCQNAFCFKCINLWRNQNAMNPTCPMCKKRVEDKNLFVVSEQQPEPTEAGPSTAPAKKSVQLKSNSLFNADYTKKLEKLKVLEMMLQSRMTDPNFKCLLFSGYETSFTKIVPILEKLNINFSFLKGRGDVVKNIVHRYKTGDVQVLLINIQDYGSGLNLENTSDVLMFHKFDSEIEKQVIGRAQRIGRTSSLKIWYLLHENERGELVTSNRQTAQAN